MTSLHKSRRRPWHQKRGQDQRLAPSEGWSWDRESETWQWGRWYWNTEGKSGWQWECTDDLAGAGERNGGQPINTDTRSKEEKALAAVQDNWKTLRTQTEKVKANREIVLAAVQQDAQALACASPALKADHEIVLTAVKLNGHALRWAAESCRGDHEIVMAAVTQNWSALEKASEALKSDHDIVLAAVKQNRSALRIAGTICRSDRDIVLAAVRQHWLSLEWAAEPCRNDRQIVSTAVRGARNALVWAADGLLEDTTFARDAKKEYYILKVSMLSGRYAVVPSCIALNETADQVIRTCAKRLNLPGTGGAKLVHGADIIPGGARIKDWPGLRTEVAEVSEYQLIVAV
mmetsp:Transcript_4750/g.8128  ORF Transcript_4750/g.8128 Transcript_4750/m.8128 type:complete len:347 (+) Transcript_4750:21-1061(+)